jgi:hypothetical protein
MLELTAAVGVFCTFYRQVGTWNHLHESFIMMVIYFCCFNYSCVKSLNSPPVPAQVFILPPGGRCENTSYKMWGIDLPDVGILSPSYRRCKQCCLGKGQNDKQPLKM